MSQDKKTPDAEDAPEAQADAAPEKSDADDAGAGGTAAAEAADGDAAVSEAREDEADAVPEAPADAVPEESDADDAGAGGTAAAEAADNDAAVSEVPEDEAPEGEAPAEAAEETAEAAVERLGAEVAELDDKLLRAVAETENLRRRAAREREETGKYAVTGFAREMLAVVDNLRRALDSLPDRPGVGGGGGETGGEAGEDDSLAGLVAGIEMTERELLAVFERQGIRRIDPMGEKFDPNIHQAVFEVADSGQPAGTVVQVVQAGYVIADRLLRPAMVGVAKAAKDDADAKDAAAHIDTEA